MVCACVGTTGRPNSIGVVLRQYDIQDLVSHSEHLLGRLYDFRHGNLVLLPRTCPRPGEFLYLQ